MTVDTKNLVNSSSGGGFSHCRVSEAKKLIQHLVEATREYEEPRLLKRAAQANSSNFEEKLEERMGRIENMLNTMVEKAAIAGPVEKPCGACGNFGHTSLQCDGNEEDLHAQVNSSHNFYGSKEPPPKRDPYSNTYNPGWRDHPNFRWRDQAQKQPQQTQQQQNYRPPHQRGFQQTSPTPPPQEKQGKSLEEMMAELIGSQQFLQNNMQQLQQTQTEQKVCIDGLARQMSQLSTSMNELKGNQGRLPSQVQVNPRENVNKITLRSGKELSEPTVKKSRECSSSESGEGSSLSKLDDSDGVAVPADKAENTSRLPKPDTDPAVVLNKKEKEKETASDEPTKVHKPLSLYDPNIVIPAPFPRRLMKKKPEEDPMDYMSIFGKLEINLPFLQAIKLPPLSKFVKDFIAGKAKDSGKIVMGENVSAVIQKKLPPKCKDPGMFSLPCYIGDTKIEHAMCDLGASINVMPLAVYNSLSGVELVDTRVVIQLADRSCVHPEGLLENVLVKVHNFVYPADFYVVRMSDMQSKDSSGVLLGRPFLRTAKSIIDVCNDTICLDYHGEKFTFSIDDAMKNPIDAENAYAIDVVDPLVQEYLETEFMQDKLELTLMQS